MCLVGQFLFVFFYLFAKFRNRMGVFLHTSRKCHVDSNLKLLVYKSKSFSSRLDPISVSLV